MSKLGGIKEKVKNLKVLFVEDEYEVRNSTEIFLNKFFDTVISSDNGENALKLFNENKDIDIILTDIQMPKKDGVSLVKEILKIKPEVHIVFVSATPTDDLVISNIDHIFIHKPVTFERIIEFLTEITEKV